jgi:4-hydroxy-2-oxoheptanedioate aldolase
VSTPFDDVGRTLRHRARSGADLLGTFCIIPSTDVVELIALAGFDFVILDLEHGPFTLETARTCLLAAAARGLSTVVRVPDEAPARIGAVLDLGADAVLVPQIGSLDAVRRAVAAARFAPLGTRGSNPWVRAADYDGDERWPGRANETVMVMVMIEGVRAIEDIDRILAVEGLDAVFLGPVDLSHALGVPGRPEHPLVLAKLAGVAAKAADTPVAVAVFAPSAEPARRWRALGVTMVACAVDSRLILEGMRAVVAEARLPPGPPADRWLG